MTALAGVAIGTVLLAAGLTAQDRPPVQSAASVNLDRYLGEWFEVARLPNRFQRQCVADVRAAYERRDDGRLRVVNSCRTSDGTVEQAEGVARVVEESGGARLKVRFAPGWLSWLPLVWGDYWIIGLADDYSWAVVGSPDRDYLWILSRTVPMANETFDRAVAIAAGQGFEVARLEPTPPGGAPGP